MHNKGKHLCVNCHRYFAEPDIEYSPDPFAEEIGGDSTPVWECDDCRYDSYMEI